MKRFYKENRVFVILMAIVAVCLIVIVGVLLKYFFFGNSSSPYGNRIKDEKKYKLSEKEEKKIVSDLQTDETIKEAKVLTKVRTIYVTITFNPGITLVEAQSKAVTVLEKFDEGQLGYYDIEFILKAQANESSEGFTIMGAKNVNGTNIVWNNNTPVATE